MRFLRGGTAALALSGATLLFVGCGDDNDANTVAAQDSERQNTAVAQNDQRTQSNANAQQSQEQEPTARERAGERLAPEGAEVQESAQVTLREEELNVTKEETSGGGVLLRKNVVTEDESETVELQREEVEVVRLSPEEARRHQEQGTPNQFSEDMSEEEVFIPLRREEAVSEKDVQTREVVRADRRTTTEEEEVDATLRREELATQRVQGEQNQQSDQGSASNSEDLKDRVLAHLRDEVGLSEQELEELDVEVQEDTVTLAGSAPEDTDGSRIEQEIRGIEGVQLVNNNL